MNKDHTWDDALAEMRALREADQAAYEKNRGIKVLIVPNGHIACFKDGVQVPELQEPWIVLWAQHAESLGYDPSKFEIEQIGGRKMRLFKAEAGNWNWEVL